jgi:RNA polymerase sigma-70 factor (ECF subfamily)
MKHNLEQRVAAFQRLADQRLDASYRLATAIMRDDGVAKDAVHDAVVLAWQRWSSLRDISKFDAWFDRIVVNVCRDRLRASKYRRVAEIGHAESLTTPDLAPQVHRRIIVSQGLARLKPDDVVVIVLRYFLDLQLDDVATLLDIPVPTAKGRLRAAMSRLRAQLQQLQQSADIDRVAP